ncbi:MULTISPECIES: phage late control D family protein [unclassified Campylobacter]|uniref:phage late control D family protein n=1 Tax=unclassified Campylobacter TaxID=2593542 RepID=UPI003D33F222
MGVASFHKPKVKILYNGKDKTAIMPWVNISIDDNEGDEADKLNIVLEYNSPKPRAKDTIEIYVNDNFLGKFIIVGIKFNYKKTIEIEAISADFTKDFKTKKNRTFLEKSYHKIISQIAKENNYNTKIDFDRSSEIVTLEQHDLSDVAFLHKIAKDLNLSFSVKNNTFIFLDRNKEKERLSYDYSADDAISLSYEFIHTSSQYKSCEVTWHNTKTGKDETVRVGSDEPTLKIVSMQDSKDEALKLAKSKLQVQKNSEIKGNMQIVGEPFFAGAYLNVYFSDTNKTMKFIIKKISHKISTAWISDIEFF